MELFGDETFADSRLPSDQHRRVDGSQAFGQEHYVLHSLAAGNNVAARGLDAVDIVELQQLAGVRFGRIVVLCQPCEDAHFLQILHVGSPGVGVGNLVQFLAGAVAPYEMPVAVVDEHRVADPVQDRQQIFDFDCLHNVVSHNFSFSYLYI